jgi:hypothetical protein
MLEEAARLGEGGQHFARRVLEAERRREEEGRVGGGGGVETLQMKMREVGRERAGGGAVIRDPGVVVPAAALPGFPLATPEQVAPLLLGQRGPLGQQGALEGGLGPTRSRDLLSSFAPEQVARGQTAPWSGHIWPWP